MFTETKEHCIEIRIDDQILTKVVINPLSLHNQSLLVHLMLLQSFTSKLLNQLLIKMGLFTLHNSCASSLLNYLKSLAESTSYS